LICQVQHNCSLRPNAPLLFNALLNNCDQVTGSQEQLQVACLRTRDIQQIVHQPVQSLALPFGRLVQSQYFLKCLYAILQLAYSELRIPFDTR